MSAGPLHERIRSDIETQILSGTAQPGDKIPSELELMQHYGCSRMTVSKALSVLSQAGLIERRKRAGTVVAQRRSEAMVLDIPDLSVEIEQRGKAYRFELVAQTLRKAAKAAPDETLLAGKASLLDVRGIHFAGDKPFAYEERLISVGAVPEVADKDFALEPPGTWLLRHIPWTEAENRIGATPADMAWAHLLAVPVGTACLTVERRTWRADERITLVRQHFVAGSYELIARFGATSNPR
jgi:GntR family transcriptional regulator, histidine utilization repressor